MKTSLLVPITPRPGPVESASLKGTNISGYCRGHTMLLQRPEMCNHYREEGVFQERTGAQHYCLCGCRGSLFCPLVVVNLSKYPS